MFEQVDTRVPIEVEQQVHSIYRELFPEGGHTFVPRAFEWARQCFAGQYEDYQAIDARYHDLEHTLQGTLCLARLLHGRQKAAAKPELTLHMFELGLLAILFHDSGYLKKKNDREGTGAKYTAIHVTRSAQFAEEFLGAKGFAKTDITAVQNMIRCTGVDADLGTIPFQSELERIVGHSLGTADLLGQMSARDYVDKLPVLYLEFAEAARFDGKQVSFITEFASADELIRNTPAFWEVLAVDHFKLLRNAVIWATNEEPVVKVTGPGMLDVTLWRQRESMTVHLVNLTNPMMMKGPFRELIPVGAQAVRLRLPDGAHAKKAHLLAARKSLRLTRDGSYLNVTVPGVADHEVVAIDL